MWIIQLALRLEVSMVVFCIQVNIENPLKCFLIFDGRRQDIQYEGLELFCFAFGKIRN